MAVKKAISIRKAELMDKVLLIVMVTIRNCFLSYILYLVVKRSQCCHNIPYILGYKSHPRIRRTPTLS